MPELPEAETIVRTLRPHIAGQRIVGAEFPGRLVRSGVIPELAGRVVEAVGRYGKQIVWSLDESFLIYQLRMTGLLLWRTEPGAYTRARFEFERGAVCFDDIRQFGSVRWALTGPDGLGPDPLEIGAGQFRTLLTGRRRRIKALLLDQRFLRGLGNIYADEVLHRAGIHPAAIASRLSANRALRLHAAIREVLFEAIASGGSSISDYVDAEGRPGRFQLAHRVYGKGGAACPRCGSEVRKIVVAQRGTHYCPACQRR